MSEIFWNAVLGCAPSAAHIASPGIATILFSASLSSESPATEISCDWWTGSIPGRVSLWRLIKRYIEYPWTLAQDVVAGRISLKTINVTARSRITFIAITIQSRQEFGNQSTILPVAFQDSARLNVALVPKFESVRETRVSLHPSIILTRDATKCNDEIERKKPTKIRSPRFVASLASEQRRPEDHWPHGIAKAVRIREQ